VLCLLDEFAVSGVALVGKFSDQAACEFLDGVGLGAGRVNTRLLSVARMVIADGGV
jgi:hypothetical protein